MTRIRATLLAGALLATLPAGAALSAPATDDLGLPATVPTRELPAAAVLQALERADRPARPQRFAVPVRLGLGLDAGNWQDLRDGAAAWRLRLRSAGASSISAHLSPVVLPAGAELWVRGAGDTAFGPYTARDVTSTGFWTPLLLADTMVLEVRVPAALKDDAQLVVAEAFHGYAVPGKAGPGSAGSCNVDAACEEATWGSEARAGAMITIANQYYCSGQLVNNVRQDRAPLFLTARHCGIGHQNGTADSVNFYFGYTTSCGGPVPPQPSATVTGATLLADDETADFTLLRMNGAAPVNAYFAGWNATGEGSPSGATLHHPGGDSQKISLFNTPTARATVDIGGACDVAAWEVFWASGTTEAGSSGGGLWNASHQLIGQLSGGNASCETPGGADYFGRLDLAWTAHPESTGQLKAHLDPDSTCIAAVPGLDPLATPTPGPVTSGPQRCSGETAVCGTGRAGGGGGGGGLPLASLALLLAATFARHRRAVSSRARAVSSRATARDLLNTTLPGSRT